MIGSYDILPALARPLRGIELRYTLVRLLQLIGPCTVPELVVAMQEWGFGVEGRPSKTVSDALRWERRRGRVRRLDRGLYRAGGMPRSTEYRIIWRVVALREEAARDALSLRGGQKCYASGAPPVAQPGAPPVAPPVAQPVAQPGAQPGAPAGAPP